MDGVIFIFFKLSIPFATEKQFFIAPVVPTFFLSFLSNSINTESSKSFFYN